MTQVILPIQDKPVDQVLFIGAGFGRDLASLLALDPAVITLVEPDHENLVSLRRAAHGNKRIKIIETAVSATETSGRFYRFNFSGVNALRSPTGLNTLFAGLMLVQETKVQVIDPVSLVNSLGFSPESLNILVIEAPGESLSILSALEKADTLRFFSTIRIRDGQVPLYENAAPMSDILEWLTLRGYCSAPDLDNSDPDFPILTLSKLPPSHIPAQSRFEATVSAEKLARSTALTQHNASVDRWREKERTLKTALATMTADRDKRQADARKAGDKAKAEKQALLDELSEARTLWHNQENALKTALEAMTSDRDKRQADARKAGDKAKAEKQALLDELSEARTLWRNQENALKTTLGEVTEDRDKGQADAQKAAEEFQAQQEKTNEVLRALKAGGDQLKKDLDEARDQHGFLQRVQAMAESGLLRESIELLGELVDHESKTDLTRDSRLSVLETGIKTLSQELALALTKGPLNSVEESGATGPDDVIHFAKQRSVAQLGQDIWVLEKTNYKTGGFFVEFGATDGVLLSNSYLLETRFGWNGICAEPNPAFLTDLKKNRNCIVSDACIGGQTGRKVEFILADVYGGFLENIDCDSHGEKRRAFQEEGKILTLTTISLNDFLLEHNAPKIIDYLSIDTEGSEYEILSSFPFEKWDIRLLTVEHNSTPMREEIFQLLSGHGYTRTAVRWDDWYERKPG